MNSFFLKFYSLLYYLYISNNIVFKERRIDYLWFAKTKNKTMKKLYTGLFIIFFSFNLFSQNWLENLPSDKPKSELTFFDYQNAFYSYWNSYNVENGYYLVDGVKRKAIGWKQFKRWEYEMKSQINPETGSFPEKTATQVFEEFLILNPPTKSASVANWTSLGTTSSTGGYGGIGRINCVAFHPTNNSIYWVGSAGGGVWVTTNNGSSWTCLTDKIGTLTISDIVIPSDYTSSNTIYIATGDKEQYWRAHSIGVLKSTDGGATWASTGLSYLASANESINRLQIDPSNNQVLLAATSNGVFKTTDGGTTWGTLLTSVNYIDLESKPGDFNTLYGSTVGGKIYMSSNSGVTWTNVFTNSNARRIELAVSSNQSSWVYAVMANSVDGLFGVYKSTNSGSSFSQVFSGTTTNLLSSDSDGAEDGGQADYDLTLACSPLDANIIIIGGINTWKSTNGGLSWNLSSHWWGDGVQAVHADKHMHKYRGNGTLFECNDGGIYISTNSGNSWTDKTDGLVISQMYRLGVSATAANETITGLQDNGTKLRSSGSWSDVKGGDGMECIIDFTNANIQYGTYVNGQISKTTNHWSSANDIEPSAAGSGSWVTPYIMDPTNHLILYAGYSNIWKSTNGGSSWNVISTMSTADLMESMAIAPSNNQVLYVADYNTIWKTMNGGTSWINITSGLPASSGSITYITVKNDDENTLWVTLGSYNSYKIFQSVNAGSTWTNISAGLPPVPVNTIVQNKQTSTSVELFAGTDVGVYYKNGMNEWVAFNTNLPNVKVSELEIYYSVNPDNTRLRAATFGRGLWETPVSMSTPTPPSAGLAVANTQCIGQLNSLTISGYSGNIQWQQSVDGVAGWMNVTTGIGMNSANYTTSSISTIMYYRAELTELTYPAVYTNVIVVNIVPPTVASITGTLTACVGDSSTLANVTPGGIWSSSLLSKAFISSEGQVTAVSSGTTIITYSVTEVGCTTTKTVVFTVKALPTVTLDPFPIVCLDWGVYALTGGSPETGTYTGTGVSGADFNISSSGTTNITYSYTSSNGCINTAQADLVVSGCADLEEFSETGYSIFPNPSQGYLTLISADEEIKSIQLLDNSGRLVKSQNMSDFKTEVILDLENCANGYYTIRVVSSSKIATKKIMISRY